MLARITTTFNCTEAELWAKIVKPQSLQFVASPILTFKPLAGGVLDVTWIVGKTYQLQLYFLRVIPLGRHDIKLVEVDRTMNRIVSNEKGLLAPVWNHSIHFSSLGAQGVHYCDEIEIKAGLLTPLIWVFAHVFYRHRQKRWKLLLQDQRTSQHQEIGYD